MDETTDYCSRILVGRVFNLSPVDRVISDYTEITLLMFSNYWYHAIPSVIFMTSVSIALKLHINPARLWSRFCENNLLKGILKLLLNLLVYSFSLFAWLLISELIYCNCLLIENMKQVAWLEKFFSNHKTDKNRQIIFWISLAVSTYLSLCFSFLFARPYYQKLKFSFLLPSRLISRLKRKQKILEEATEKEEGIQINYQLHSKKNRLNTKRWKPATLKKSIKTKK